MELKMWVLAYPLTSGHMTQQEWDKVFTKFCADYQKFLVKERERADS